MKKYLVIVLLLIIAVFSLYSQTPQISQLRIIGKAEKTSDIVQEKYQTVNKMKAACIIFVTDLTVDIDIKARTETVDFVQPSHGQYQVYVAPGERSVTVHAKGYVPLEVVLRDYGISNLRSGEVYKLQLTGDSTRRTADADLFTVQFDIEPVDVYISYNNGAPTPVRGNSARFRLPAGQGRFIFSKQGYKDETVQLTIDKDVTQQVRLTQGTTATKLTLPGFVTIDTEPTGAEVFLNEQYVGTTPYTGQVPAGEHKYRFTLPLYQTEEGSFSLKEGETLSLPKFELKPQFGTITIESTPSGAEVLLNNQSRGKTPINNLRLDSGAYELELRLSNYHDYTESFFLKEAEVLRKPIRMKPAFGELSIDSTPEIGANVYIDEVRVGTTPFKENRPSGRYLIRVEKELYSPITRYVEVSDGVSTKEVFNLPSNFGNINVSSSGAEIYLNDKYVGINTYSSRLVAGNHTILAKKDRHYDAKEQFFISAGERKNIFLEPEPRLGALSVSTKPFKANGAEIFVNNEKRTERTPAIFPILIGDYQVTVKHRDFLDATQKVTIREGIQSDLSFNMQTYQGSMLAKANFWSTNKWVSLSSALVLFGGAVYFDYQGKGYVEDYKKANSYRQEQECFENSEKSFDLRDICLAVNVLPVGHTVYSWIRETIYRSKI